ncbi:MAG TPA: ABC transporter permease [Allosphingosinicella sp.]|jgi:hypothetical protein
MLDAFRAERLKLRRLRLPLLAVASGAAIAALAGLGMHGAAARIATERNLEMPWQNGVIGDAATNLILILPALVTLLTALAFYVEHRGGMWKQLRLVPRSPWALHAAKFAAIQLLLAVALGTALTASLAGWHGLPQVLHAEIGVTDAIAYRNMIFMAVALYLSLLPVSIIQFLLSARLSNILHPVGMGLVLTFASLALFGPKTAPYLPYAWPGAVVMATFAPAEGTEVQRADPSFRAQAGALVGPRSGAGAILFDSGHGNRHTLTSGGGKGSIGWMADAAIEAGIPVREADGPIGPEALRDVDLLVVGAAALPPSPEEVLAIDAWVSGGGALLLLTDHEPFALPAQALARRLGVGTSLEMVAGNESGTDRRLYRVRWGASPAELRVRAYGGQALWREAAGGARLLPLAGEIRSSRGGLIEPPAQASQMLAFSHGRGRVVLSGDSGLFTAQSSEGGPIGVADRSVDNERFVVEILRWLLRQSAPD